MKGKYWVLIVAFSVLCVYPLVSFNIGQNVSDASSLTVQVQNTLPIPWEKFEEAENGAKFLHERLWVAVEETSTTKTANVFMLTGEREGNDLVLFFWSYTYDKENNFLLSGLNPVRISRFFEGYYDPNIVYMPPADLYTIYSDATAENLGLEKFKEGTIGLLLREDGANGVQLPWGRGFISKWADNPG